MIGNDIPSLVRTAKVLQQHPVAAIDLNLGCPAPIVYRKCAGGGLLREPERIDAILGALREAVPDPVHGQDPRRLRVHGGVRPVAADLRAAPARRADRARPHRRAALPDAGALRAHPSGRGRDALSGHRQRARAFGGPGRGRAAAHRRPRADDRPRRHPQSVAVRADPATARRPAGDAADRARGVGLRARAVGLAGLLRQARAGAVRPDEEVRQLSRRRRAAAVSRSHPSRADRRRVPRHLRRGVRPRPADGARAGRPDRAHALPSRQL